MSRRENSGPEKYKGSFKATQGTFAPDSHLASFLLDLVTSMISRIFASLVPSDLWPFTQPVSITDLFSETLPQGMSQ